MSAMRSASSTTAMRDVRQVDDPLRDQVLQPAGAGDDDVDAALQRGLLRSVADAAVDGEHAPIEGRRQRHQLLADLLGQLTGGDEHERRRPAGPRLLGARRQRQREGQRLAGARRGAAGDVVAGQRVGKDGGLDGEGGGDPATVERRHERGGHAEVGEGGGQERLQFEGDERPARVDPFLRGCPAGPPATTAGVDPAPCRTSEDYRRPGPSPRMIAVQPSRARDHPRSIGTGSIPSPAGSSKPRIWP